MAKPKYTYELKYEENYQYFDIYRNDQLIYTSLAREKTEFYVQQLYGVIKDLLYSSDDNNRKIFQREEIYLKAISDKKTGNTISFSNDPKSKEIQKVKDEQIVSFSSNTSSNISSNTSNTVPSNTPGNIPNTISSNITNTISGNVANTISGNVQSAKELAANAQKAKEAAANAAKELAAKAKAAKELATKKAKELADKAKKAKELVAQQKKKFEDLKKAANDKVNFLKDQAKISPSQAKAAILAILLPILTKFINAEKAANAIINRLISKTKKQLKNKGRVTVNGGKIVFTPKDNGNYQRFKQDFDRKVKSLKNIVQTLKTILDTLLTILRIMKAALLAAKVYATILRAKMKKLAAKAAVEAASPSPAKPANAEYLAFKEINEPIIEELEKKIDDYVSIIAAATAILSTFQKLVSRILDKLNTLSLTITSQPGNNLNEDLVNIINQKPTQTLTYEYTSINNKEYIIRITTTPSGAKQAVAYDKFSNLKITQTAPSLVRNEDELLEELKQILG
jgi:hypothetical protein